MHLVIKQVYPQKWGMPIITEAHSVFKFRRELILPKQSQETKTYYDTREIRNLKDLGDSVQFEYLFHEWQPDWYLVECWEGEREWVEEPMTMKKSADFHRESQMFFPFVEEVEGRPA